ncbi:MAG: ATP-binding protein [Promethearchaeota archaeon]
MKLIGIRVNEKFDAKSREAKLQEMASQFHDFHEIFDDIKEISVFEVDTKGFIRSNLRGGAELFGYSQEDIDKGINALELFIPEERGRILQRLSNTILEVTQKDREYIGLRKDGTTFPVCIYSKPVFKDDNIVGRRGIAIDITELKKIERELINKNKASLLKTTEMERLTYTITHDLKAPLTSINGFIDLLKDENKEKFSEDSNFYLKRISENIVRMSRKIDKILEYSRIGKVNEEKGSHSLVKIINEVVVTFTPQLQENNVQIEVEKDLPRVYVQRERFIQVFENLIDNTIKYMGKRDKGRARIGKKDLQEDFVTLYVQDCGIGIQKEYLPSLFQLFTRIPNGLSNEVSGSGVGLANVKKIIETHGGSIWVESEYEKGTTFYFTIPLKK